MGDRGAAARLLRLRDALRGYGPLAADDASPIADAIDGYFGGAELASAFGLKPDPGTPDPRNALRLAHRDALICDAAEEFLAHIASDTGRADELRTLLDRYRVTGWERGDREAVDMPIGYRGTLRGALWEILAEWPSKQTLSARRIRTILAAGSGY
jgi:hypothetical protein